MTELLSYTDFTLMDDVDKKAALEEYTKKFTVKEISKEWGENYSKTYGFFQKYNVKIIKRGRKGPSKGTRKTINGSKDKEKMQLPAVIVQKKETEEKKMTEKPNGLSLSYNGEYSSSEIANRLENLGFFLSDEKGKFKIELTIRETNKV
ncbi:hypothetical protein MZM54_00015 [[Brevibacterium] frigoritolerans]|nr:hypothetical protein [Peribacillus frigoritolerans]